MESSLVVTLFTREFGKIGALAKGAKRLKSPFESALDLLALCRIVFLHKTSEALDLLTKAKLLRRFRPHGRDLLNLYAAYYVAELVGELTDDGDPYPELSPGRRDLAALAAGQSVARRLIRFELGTLRILGHMPSLETCAGCGAAVTASGRMVFGQIEGGVLCERCRTGKKQVALISAGTVKTMAQLADAESQTWQLTGNQFAHPGRIARRDKPLFAKSIGTQTSDARIFGSAGKRISDE